MENGDRPDVITIRPMDTYLITHSKIVIPAETNAVIAKTWRSKQKRRERKTDYRKDVPLGTQNRQKQTRLSQR